MSLSKIYWLPIALIFTHCTQARKQLSIDPSFPFYQVKADNNQGPQQSDNIDKYTKPYPSIKKLKKNKWLLQRTLVKAPNDFSLPLTGLRNELEEAEFVFTKNSMHLVRTYTNEILLKFDVKYLNLKDEEDSHKNDDAFVKIEATYVNEAYSPLRKLQFDDCLSQIVDKLYLSFDNRLSSDHNSLQFDVSTTYKISGNRCGALFLTNPIDTRAFSERYSIIKNYYDSTEEIFLSESVQKKLGLGIKANSNLIKQPKNTVVTYVLTGLASDMKHEVQEQNRLFINVARSVIHDLNISLTRSVKEFNSDAPLIILKVSNCPANLCRSDEIITDEENYNELKTAKIVIDNDSITENIISINNPSAINNNSIYNPTIIIYKRALNKYINRLYLYQAAKKRHTNELRSDMLSLPNLSLSPSISDNIRSELHDVSNIGILKSDFPEYLILKIQNLKSLTDFNQVSLAKYFNKEDSAEFILSSARIELQNRGHCLFEANDLMLPSKIDISKISRNDLTNSILKYILAHQLAHNVGLSHNFMGSFDQDNFSLKEEKTTRQYSTVMDYLSDGMLTYNGYGPTDEMNFRVLYSQMLELDAALIEYLVNTGRATEDGKDYLLKLPSGSFKLHNRKYIQLEDYRKALGIQSWNELTNQHLIKFPIKRHLSCRDTDLGKIAVCNPYDYGTTPSEIVSNNIAKYKYSYELRNLNMKLEYKNFTDYEAIVTQYFLPLRLFLEETFFHAQSNSDQETLKAHFQAASIARNFFIEIIRTPQASLKQSNIDRFKSFKSYGIDFKFEQKWLEDRILDADDNRLLTKGILFDKLLALYLLTSRDVGFAKRNHIKSSYNFIDLDELVNSDEDSLSLPTSDLLYQIANDHIKPQVNTYMGYMTPPNNFHVLTHSLLREMAINAIKNEPYSSRVKTALEKKIEALESVLLDKTELRKHIVRIVFLNTSLNNTRDVEERKFIEDEINMLNDVVQRKLSALPANIGETSITTVFSTLWRIIKTIKQFNELNDLQSIKSLHINLAFDYPLIAYILTILNENHTGIVNYDDLIVSEIIQEIYQNLKENLAIFQ